MLAGLIAPPPQADKPIDNSAAAAPAAMLRNAQRQPGDKARGWR
ncbi:MAG: hypothetical protein RR100_24175 [Comamonas sp.]